MRLPAPVNLKKVATPIKFFVLFLTLAAISCGGPRQHVSRIEGKEIGISAANADDAAVENLVRPYREHIDADLNKVLAYAPETIDKSGKWQTPMGNLFADVAMRMGKPVFMAREHKKIDIVMLNHGGIRTIIPKGNITTRTAFEIMPFENSMVVAALNGAQITEMMQYIIAEKKPHPLAGLTFTIGKDGTAETVLVQGKPFAADAVYYVGTNDYLYNGGDNMTFFKKAVAKYDLDYKLRNILIDYFTQADTVIAPRDVRISEQ